MNWQHLRVLRAIERCRTAALGGHVDQCSRCGQQAISCNSCRNRHCGKCQTNARDKIHPPYAFVPPRLGRVRQTAVRLTAARSSPGRYAHRVAISNYRLVNFADGQVTFRWKDYAHGSKQKLMTAVAPPCS